MATHANTTVNNVSQARTCAALMDAFCDADDAYAAAVEWGETDREAVMTARSEALVAFLTGPRPRNTAEAYQVIFAALQAVVDGNDFDIAWRATVCPALSLLGVRGASAAPALDDPCIAVCRDFIAKHAAMDASPEPDIPEQVSDAACEAWEHVKGQRPVTVAGFAAQLRSATIWIGETECGDPDIQAMFRGIKGLCDLIGFDEGQALTQPQSVPMAELRLVATDYHVGRYRDYLAALAAIASRPDDIADEASDVMFDRADETFDDLMEGSATTFTGVMLKARAAHHWAMQRAQGSVMSPRAFADLLGIIAADLEVLTAGKAVRS